MDYRSIELDEPGLHEVGSIDENYPSQGYGVRGAAKGASEIRLPKSFRDGTAFIMVASGSVTFDRKHDRCTVGAGEYAAAPGLKELRVAAQTRASIALRLGYLGVFAHGGPIEQTGRLRYIDGCTDSLLIHPPRLGDPCLNHLHFPPGVDQTMHTHPTVRFGSVMRGMGECVFVDADGVEQRATLTPGLLWIIPPGSHHKFRTDGTGTALDVIAYHPDSDWGPEDEEHPMLNRTLVDGERIDNTRPEHAIVPDLPPAMLPPFG